MEMLNSLMLFTTVALLCGGVFAQIDDSKLDLDNELQANVVEPPRRRLRSYVRIEMSPVGTVKHTPGEPLILTCDVMGSPLPSVHWLKNGEPLMEYEQETNEILSVDESSIGRVTTKLPVMSSSNLEDVYTCVGRNAGLMTKTMSTTVYTEQDPDASQLLTRLKFLGVSRKPIITMVYSEVLQEMGTDLLVPCQVHSHPKSQVIWSDSTGVPLNFAGHPRIKILPSGAMMMSNLHWAEMGVYTCTAKNMYGTTTANTFIYPMKS